MDDFTCLVLADGKGTRFGMEKQFAPWGQKMLWQVCYELACDLTKDRVVVGVDINGGPTRQASVKSGLRLVDTKRVVIMEAARPLVTLGDVERLLKEDYPSVTYGSVLDTPVYNLIEKKYSPNDMCLIHNLQVFDTELLREAHAKTAMEDAPDDTILMHEVHDIAPRILKPKNEASLYRVIYPTDMMVVDALISTFKTGVI